MEPIAFDSQREWLDRNIKLSFRSSVGVRDGRPLIRLVEPGLAST